MSSLLAIMALNRSEYLLIVICDMPYRTEETLEVLHKFQTLNPQRACEYKQRHKA